MKASVLVFPGSNREGDVAQAIELVTGRRPQMVWHGDGDFEKTDLIVVPGGFSYGDYLRCGAMAAQSPVMAEVKRRAAQGVPVLGICNGFQIVTEAGLLPGVLMRNAHQQARFSHDLEAVADAQDRQDRKSTRLNSSHQIISSAVFFLE